MRRISRFRLGLSIVALALPACSTTTRSVTGLAPAAPGEQVRGRASSSIRLSLDESLRAEVRATDLAGAGEAVPTLGLRLVFDPKLLGYSFDPGQLVLRDGHGSEWRPSSVSAGWLRYGTCETAHGMANAIGSYIPLAPGTCINVGFARPVRAGDRLELVVAGAALGQRPLASVAAALSRTEEKSRKASPGLVEMLTLPLKILLFPLAMYGGM